MKIIIKIFLLNQKKLYAQNVKNHMDFKLIIIRLNYLIVKMDIYLKILN